MDFVLDCSATMSWILANDDTGYAERVLSALSGATAHVPAIWPLEVANVLLVFERRQHLNSKHSLAFMNALQQMPIVMETTLQTRVFDRVHELGAKHALSAYDAAYLEIGLRNGIPLATLDDKLRDAAEASGAGIFAPE